jgi:hypothetical protein
VVLPAAPSHGEPEQEHYYYYLVPSDMAVEYEAEGSPQKYRFAVVRDEADLERALRHVGELNAARARWGLPPFKVVDTR